MVNNYFKKFRAGVEFMGGREKHEVAEVFGEPVHIDQWAYLSNADGSYPVFTLAEYPDAFFFGNAILLEMLETVEADGMADELPNQVIVFAQKKSKKGRDYTFFDFV